MFVLSVFICGYTACSVICLGYLLSLKFFKLVFRNINIVITLSKKLEATTEHLN